nr:LysR substrate-binding domain-containing protein [Pseudorhodoferax sp. Leaf274]
MSSDVPIEIHPTTDLVDIEKGDADVAVRFAHHAPNAHFCERLMDDEWFPVAAPGYLERIGASAGHEAFRQASLLAHTRQPWQPWLEKAGLTTQAARRTMTFSDTGFMLDAALRLQGIALGRRSLVHDLLRTGALVRVSEISLHCEQSYYLLATERAAIAPHGRTVIRWIQALCAGSQVQA